MKWSDITVSQFQEIYKLSTQPDIDDFDRTLKTICILYNKTETEVDEMQLSELLKLAEKCAFVNGESIPGRLPKRVKGHKINYDPKALSLGKYTDLIAFSEKPIENMHLILATVIRKQPWYYKFRSISILKPFIKEYNPSEDLHRISEKLLSAKITQAFHANVFFCKVWNDSTGPILGFSKRGMTTESKKARPE